jgi:HlyD family secretion protein
MKTFITLFLILTGITVGGWIYFKGGKDEAPQYQTATVGRGDVIQVVAATGTLNPMVKVQVGSQISGNIQKLNADYNSEVKAGQVVAQLDPATFQAIVHQSEGELESSRAALRLAQLTAKRQKDLAEQKIATAAALDDSEAALRQAEAQVQIRTAQLEKAKVDLSRCTIYAPIDGVVISRSVDVGQTVAASLSAPVMFVIANDLRNMQIDTNVGEADVGNIEIGQAVNFDVDAFPYRKFHGKVAQVRIEPITVQNVVTYDTIIEVNNEDMKLKPGMTANVSVVIAERHDTLKIPNSALRYRPPDAQKAAATPDATAPGAPAAPGGGENVRPGGGQRGPGGGGGARRGGGGGPGGPGGGSGFRRREGGTGGGPVERTIYLLVNGQPQPTKVKLGITDSIFTEVIDGLKEGDVVVTGSNVAPAADPTAGGARPGGSPFGGGMRRF